MFAALDKLAHPLDKVRSERNVFILILNRVAGVPEHVSHLLGNRCINARPRDEKFIARLRWSLDHHRTPTGVPPDDS